ncbi:MAG: IS3 family transposase [Rickettsiaceae bacterium]|nr:IS3 family transposase [Rickettsiaceae bacterium]
MEKKRAIIEHDKADLTIAEQCKLIGLNRSSYYARPKSLELKDYEIMRKIDEVFTEHPYFGTRRMEQELRDVGYDIGRKKVRHYYRIMGIEAIYPKMNLSKRNQAHKVYPYLLRNYKITGPNKVYSTDITYIRLKHGFVYLVAVIDWYSRYILSWRVSISLDNSFCVEAVCEAIMLYGSPKIFNTDQGVQYTSKNFIAILEQYQIAISMDGKGRALDNIFIERFWRSLKQEKIYRMDLESVKEAKEAISEYMEFYNKRRKHQSLGYKTPEAIHFAS